ncbi:hypothetical protein [Streptomyces sp. TS71-3]|uniref:hypothetical protein n=1 Tax=Streptomyces sp. TS71-3 TaxID=2733862 RepID=UPI001B0172EA|nr:hypothetical protein [Streptomyces sp. TS71-3]GHJ35434.1 hypothetical protein Sm713_10430 [Streptomyces sp. TS71-3]
MQTVQVPIWMWVKHSTWEPVAVSVPAGDVTVTAVARPQVAVWSMGDGAEVFCHGPGTPYSDRYSPKAGSPDCGYTYRHASVSSPGGAYTLSVRVVWIVQWHGAGRSGTMPGLVTAAHRQLAVGEVQAVATADGG